jgi:hypothetical protein
MQPPHDLYHRPRSPHASVIRTAIPAKAGIQYSAAIPVFTGSPFSRGFRVRAGISEVRMKMRAAAPTSVLAPYQDGAPSPNQADCRCLAFSAASTRFRT